MIGSTVVGNPGSERRDVSAADGSFEVTDVSVGKLELVAFQRGGGREAKYDLLHKSLTLAAEPAVQELGDIEMIGKRLGPEQSPGDLGFAVADWDPAMELSDWKPVIATVRVGGPADGTGIAAGDVIAKVDGHAVQGADYSRYRTLTTVAEGSSCSCSRGARRWKWSPGRRLASGAPTLVSVQQPKQLAPASAAW